MQRTSHQPRVNIACGGTGGHLIPGRVVADALRARGCEVTLMISSKEVDQQAARSAAGLEMVLLPAVGWSPSQAGAFAWGCWRSWRVVRRWYRAHPPQAVLAMGGFTSVAPVLGARLRGVPTYVHESNIIPGRANRFLARWVTRTLVGFPQAASRLRGGAVEVVGTPVRAEFQPGSSAAARMALGLDPQRAVLLAMGGSQGASALNELMIRSLPALQEVVPGLQFLHLTGPRDAEKVAAAYRVAKRKAVVRPFLTEMELALDAATVAVSRAGGSSLAELAAMRLPSILVPYPFAADDHQFHNARAYVEAGAARMLVQGQAEPALLAGMVRELVLDETRRDSMKRSLAQQHRPEAAARIAETIMRSLDAPACGSASRHAGGELLSGPEISQMTS
jgi:UDP-N-acetylglucosamine--N-acetylmuramyl-(pentapeptide) pyrophosphoryl-undecaprenol N-acetylglucosamine transferase